MPGSLNPASTDRTRSDGSNKLESPIQGKYVSSATTFPITQEEHLSVKLDIDDQVDKKTVSLNGAQEASLNGDPPAIKSTVTWKSPCGEENAGSEQSKPNRWDSSRSNESAQPSQERKRGIFHLRGYDDDEDTDWWFASTAVPLLAATLAPLANVLSIAALVTYWRTDLRDPDNPGELLSEFNGILFEDPRWCYWLNVVTLICGFIGNIFLLANFTGRIRYIIALPCTIVFWFVSTSVLIAITIAMNTYVPPERPYETYSQGFWYAVIAAVLYLVCSFLLMLNMLGYFLGHYPQRFELSDHQRTLILQTMLFFIWLAGGGYIFSVIESRGSTNKDWAFVDGLYFCDVTILTVGFGDLTLRNDLGRALIFPYTVGGIIMLGLVISSISKFAAEMSQDNVVRKHFERVRTRTLERTATHPQEAEKKAMLQSLKSHSTVPSAPIHARLMHHSIVDQDQGAYSKDRRLSSAGSERRGSLIAPVRRRTNLREAVKMRKQKVRLLRHERDRFDEMRRIQQATQRFKRYWALSLSVCAFAVLWLLGAVVFWLAERGVQGMSYFQALYFAYISLLTIGYGDFAPQSNAGRPFFVVWSLIAVPTITLLINDMGSTVIDSFKKGTFIAADWTILLRRGIWSDFLKAHPKVDKYLSGRKDNKERKKRMDQGLGLPAGEDDAIVTREGDMEQTPHSGRQKSRQVSAGDAKDRDLNHLARELTKDTFKAPTESELAHHLSDAIRSVTKDLSDTDRKYTFEEWAELTRLIRFTSQSATRAQEEEDEDPIDWDWLGDHSPMMANMSEPEFVMEKLCHSLARNMMNMERKVEAGKLEIERLKQPHNHVEMDSKERRRSHDNVSPP